MAFILNDRVKVTSTTAGTGVFALGGAAAGFETFATGIGGSNTTYYAIAHQSAAEFEVGFGTLDADGDALTRTYIINSSNSDAAVNFSSGTKDVFCTMPASKVGLPFPQEYGSSSAPKVITVKVASKSGSHPYQGQGSSSAYYLDGLESPAIRFSGVDPSYKYYYRFDQSHSSNSGHPLRFYEEADKSTAFTTGVTTNGSPGSSGAYTQIAVDDDTPNILYYQCSSHSLMGNHAVTVSNAFNGDVNFKDNIFLVDNKKINLGNGSDLQIYHDGGNSYLDGGDVGAFYIRGGTAGQGGLNLTDSSGGGRFLVGNDGGATELYHNSSNAKKLETTTTGVQTTGTLNVNGAYTLPTSDGSAGQALQTDGSGAVTFGSAGASTGFVIAMSIAL